jgi:hypothetical protein
MVIWKHMQAGLWLHTSSTATPAPTHLPARCCLTPHTPHPHTPYQVLDTLVQIGQISEERAADIRSKYDALHAALVAAMEREKQLLATGQSLHKDALVSGVTTGVTLASPAAGCHSLPWVCVWCRQSLLAARGAGKHTGDHSSSSSSSSSSRSSSQAASEGHPCCSPCMASAWDRTNTVHRWQ